MVTKEEGKRLKEKDRVKEKGIEKENEDCILGS